MKLLYLKIVKINSNSKIPLYDKLDCKKKFKNGYYQIYEAKFRKFN